MAKLALLWLSFAIKKDVKLNLRLQFDIVKAKYFRDRARILKNTKEKKNRFA